MTAFADPSTFPSIFDPSAAAPVDAAAEGTTPEIVEEAPEGFDSLGLPHKLVRALAREGIVTPFEIQKATVPDALAGKDVLGRGQTGSGKTLAFGLPVLARLARGERARPKHPRALVLVPTRELAMQVNDALLPLGKALGVFLRPPSAAFPTTARSTRSSAAWRSSSPRRAGSAT